MQVKGLAVSVTTAKAVASYSVIISNKKVGELAPAGFGEQGYGGVQRRPRRACFGRGSAELFRGSNAAALPAVGTGELFPGQ